MWEPKETFKRNMREVPKMMIYGKNRRQKQNEIKFKKKHTKL